MPSLVEIGPVVLDKMKLKSLQSDGKTTGIQKSSLARLTKNERRFPVLL